MSLTTTFISLFIIIIFTLIFYLFVTIPIFSKRINKNDITSDNTNVDTNINSNDIQQTITQANELLTSSYLQTVDVIEECKIRKFVGKNIWESTTEGINQNRACLLPGEGSYSLNEYICTQDQKLSSIFPTAPTYCYNTLLAKKNDGGIDTFPHIIERGERVTAYQECKIKGKPYELCNYNYVKISLNWTGQTSNSNCLTLENSNIILKPCKPLNDYISTESNNQLFIVQPPNINEINKFNKSVPTVTQLIPFNSQSKNLAISNGKLILVDISQKKFFAIENSIFKLTALSLSSNNQAVAQTVRKQQHITYLDDKIDTIINQYDAYFSNALYEDGGQIKYYDGVGVIPKALENNLSSLLIVN